MILWNINSQTLVVASYNIQYGMGVDFKFNISRAAQDIKLVSPDLIGLQEVDNFTDRNPYSQPQELGRQTGYLSIFGKSIDSFGGQFGNTILTRFPVLEKLHETFTYFPDKENRSALAIRIRVEEKYLWFITVHLDYEYGSPAQIQQCKDFNKFLSRIRQEYPNDHLIVTGDFNNVPGSQTWKMMAKTLKDAWREAAEGDGFTLVSNNLFQRIDYVFISPGVKASACKVLCTTSSDHCMVIAQIEI